MSTITLEPNEVRIDLSYFSEPEVELVFENGVGIVRVQEQRENEMISALQAMEDQMFSVAPGREEMLEQGAVYEQMHPQLKEKHLGQYIAIHKGELVDSDADRTAIFGRVRANYPDQVVMVRKVEAELPKPMRISSALYRWQRV